MSVIILIGDAEKYMEELKAYFQNKYSEIICMVSDYDEMKRVLMNSKKKKLYILSGRDKPERYELFCLARKNSEKLISISDFYNEESVKSDRNLLVLRVFDGKLVESRLEEGSLNQTTSTERTKGISRIGLGSLKKMINKQNNMLLEKYKSIEVILKQSEEKLVQMWNRGNGLTIEDAEKYYLKTVIYELEEQISFKSI